jgi:hypothetical protein
MRVHIWVALFVGFSLIDCHISSKFNRERLWGEIREIRVLDGPYPVSKNDVDNDITE